ncbi:DNA polymerase III subunit gamma/tau [Paucibacter sp. R3-3]|uniref:DNA polymerase III subunit gamma/tau n=1 Tax=Roseateles agri TaxID=3098619 RepID=A0ABU5DN52_9BURK|nr:DNA polymerase III subunit gamma/tau [Paucibacter sp. R3-3]MDY0747153.1 DNA polymerase III subunit gamma/tau [Paucibacter sp. R3-3]
MSYLVLARKYRPRAFEEMVGQEHVVQALSNALTQQRLHHAYLFTGTRGVGKTTVSRILAKSLNCTGPDGSGGITATPCGVCDACRDIDSGRFVDYVELDAASNRGVEEISQLLDQAVYKPVVGRFKVYMIDEVHMLSNTAFNAMLKTLEEPPEYLKFVLATTDPQKVPVTVLSRCLQFNLRPMAPQNVLSHLTSVLQTENVPAEPGALRLLARAARGSMRDALSLTDQAIAFGAGSLTEPGVRQMLGSVDRSHVTAILDALAAADGAAVVAQADALRSLGLSAAGTLEDLAGLLQQMAVAQAAPRALDEQDPDTAEARRLAALLPADEIQLMYSMALHGRQELALAPDEYAGLLMVLLRMLAFRPAGAASQQPVKPPAAKAEPAPAVAAAPLLAPVAPKVVVPVPVPVAAPPVAASRPPVPEPVREPAPVRAPEPPPVRTAVDPSSPSARLRPRAMVQPVEQEADDDLGPPPAGDEPPPWLDAGPDDDVAVSAADLGDPDFGENDAPAERSKGYASTAGADVVFEPTPLGERWHAQVMTLGLTALPRELAMQAQCIGFSEEGETQVWRLRVERDSLRQPALKDKLQTALNTALQRPVRIELEAGVAQDSPALREAAAAQAKQREIERIVVEDPIAQALLADFKTARIVPGSIRSILH